MVVTAGWASELIHLDRVVVQEVVLKGVPAAPHPHHQVFPMEKLEAEEFRRLDSDPKLALVEYKSFNTSSE